MPVFRKEHAQKKYLFLPFPDASPGGRAFPSHRRDPSSIPCAPLKIGAFCIFGTGLIRQLPAHLGKTRQQQEENPGTLFRKCFFVSPPLCLGDRRIPFPTTSLGQPFQLRLRTLSCSWRRSAAIRLAEPRSVTRDGRYEVPVQAS
jgi:hypothetical protein